MADSDPTEERALSRWSRLKREARSPGAEMPSGPERPPAEVRSRGPEGSASEDEGGAGSGAPADATVADLPDIETLTYESDFTAFLREGVPEELRRLALRKLWRSDPVLANVDGLNDYDLDYKSLGVDSRVTEALLAQREERERNRREAAAPSDGPDGTPVEEGDGQAKEGSPQSPETAVAAEETAEEEGNSSSG